MNLQNTKNPLRRNRTQRQRRLYIFWFSWWPALPTFANNRMREKLDFCSSLQLFCCCGCILGEWFVARAKQCSNPRCKLASAG